MGPRHTGRRLLKGVENIFPRLFIYPAPGIVDIEAQLDSSFGL